MSGLSQGAGTGWRPHSTPGWRIIGILLASVIERLMAIPTFQPPFERGFLGHFAYRAAKRAYDSRGAIIPSTDFRFFRLLSFMQFRCRRGLALSTQAHFDGLPFF
jgi:hypothetical protein